MPVIRIGPLTATARAVGLDLLRRRGAVLLLSLVPAAFYLSVSGEAIAADEEPWTLVIGSVGIAWAVAGGSFFLALSARTIDTRLLLAGHRSGELMVGRIAFLLAFALTVAAAQAALLAFSSDARWLPLALALGTTGVIAVFLGLALASVLPRELEGTIALVLVVGIQTSVPVRSPIAPWLPFYGPVQLVRSAWFAGGAVGPWLAHAGASSLVLLVLSWLAWARTTYVRSAPRHM